MNEWYHRLLTTDESYVKWCKLWHNGKRQTHRSSSDTPENGGGGKNV